MNITINSKNDDLSLSGIAIFHVIAELIGSKDTHKYLIDVIKFVLKSDNDIFIMKFLENFEKILNIINCEEVD